MHNKKIGAFFFLFLFLVQMTIPNNTFFKFAFSQNISKTASTTINPLNNQIYKTNSQDIQKIKVGDITIAYKKFGKGNPLLLIMGFAGGLNTWEPNMTKKLSQNHTVIIFDNRGIGGTSLGNKNLSISQFAQDAVGLIDALHLNKTDIMGFSMGGFIAQEVALSNPEKINKMIIYASGCGGNEGTFLSQNLSQITQNSKSPKEFYDKLIPLIFPQDWLSSHLKFINNPNGAGFPSNITMQMLQNQYKAISSWHNAGVCNQLGKINMPTLIIVGTKDVLQPKVDSLIMAEKIPDSWLIRIQGGGHAMMTQYPDKMASIIESFLEKN